MMPLLSLGFYVLLLAACLFIPYGGTGWAMAWVYIAVYGGAMAGNSLILMLLRPELIGERNRIRNDTKGWDKVLGLLVTFSALSICVISGLDVRFGWLPPLPAWLSFAAVAVAVPGHLLFLWALASNRFFSATVRVQRERGHKVVTGGPYRYLRHPGYTGSIALNLAAPLVLGSAVGLVPAALTICLIVLRTSLEDRMLREELEGYEGFARRVRFRLLPGVW